MTNNRAKLILHPVRLRILQAFTGDRHLSARQLCELLPEVPPASLYRHFQKLVKAEILIVVGEDPVRGAVEKFYRLDRQNAEISDAESAQLTPADHQQYFTTFVATLLADFDRYLQQEDINLRRDGVGYRQMALNLSQEELIQLVAEVSKSLQPFLANKPSPGRNRILLSTILMPDCK